MQDFGATKGGCFWYRLLLINIKHGVGVGRGCALRNTSTTQKPVQDFVHQLCQMRHCFGFPESTLPQVKPLLSQRKMVTLRIKIDTALVSLNQTFPNSVPSADCQLEYTRDDAALLHSTKKLEQTWEVT